VTLALYSPSYWDVVVDVEPAALAGGKGKHPAPSTVVVGGFAWNAARVLAAAGRAGLRVVTVVPTDEDARVRAAAPAGVALDAIAAPPGWLPITVVLDPGGACRILRDPGAALDGAWRWDAVSAAARAAAVHVLGRVPAGFARRRWRRRRAGARIAWRGAGLPVDALAGFDVACVIAAEAATVLGATATATSTAEAAQALAERATGADAVRVVTGGARQPTVAAARRGAAIELHAVEPAPLAPGAIVTLLGAGDAFAAALVATACLTEARCRPRSTWSPAARRRAAAQLIPRPRWLIRWRSGSTASWRSPAAPAGCAIAEALAAAGPRWW
jgi:sugar/nucleoside kinase (ribokinase family)